MATKTSEDRVLASRGFPIGPIMRVDMDLDTLIDYHMNQVKYGEPCVECGSRIDSEGLCSCGSGGC